MDELQAVEEVEELLRVVPLLERGYTVEIDVETLRILLARAMRPHD